MLDFETDKILSLEEAARRCGGLHRTTLSRYANHGHNGVYLESYRIGGRRVTTVSALQRFITSLNTNAEPTPST